ncbi:hypothetical protein LG296_04930 [Ureibacillus chungkukjangi]|uniref:hypothetical protein n=1 Tax=Ureibacillus chungkukjangi TaxID=1202712 RepID=UPI00384F130C
MKGSSLRKGIAIFMIAFMLFWSALPSITMAFFITPGNAINAGDPISGGQPITGGQFIIPGDPVDGGNAYQGGPVLQGGNGAISGQPLIPPYQSSNGQWIIPNVAGTLPINNPILTGGAMTGGEGPSGGEAVNGGNATEGGEGTTCGEAVNGGEGSTSGDSITGGDPTKGGEGPTSGNVGSGGDPAKGGEGPTGGNAGSGGDPAEGGEGPSGGNATDGGDAGNGGTTTGSNSIDAGSSAEVDRGIAGDIHAIVKNTRRYITSFGKTFMEGATAAYAGFDFQQLKSGNYKVVGKSSIKNPVFNYFYDNYKKYSLDGRDAYMPAGKSNPKPYRVTTFLDSKKFTNFSSVSSALSSSWSSVKSSLNDGFNVFSKKFWSLSNTMKLNGPVNLISSAFTSVYDYGWGNKSNQGLLSSNFAADLTVDVAVGAGTTALSAALSSAAAGAVAGSVVPGLGTAVGAVVGLGAGLLSTYLINGTEPGRRAKKWVSEKLSQGYSKVADGAKGLFNGAKKLFGFG